MLLLPILCTKEKEKEGLGYSLKKRILKTAFVLFVMLVVITHLQSWHNGSWYSKTELVSKSDAIMSNRPVEPKRKELKPDSLCPSYSTEFDKYDFTSDEGRCMYEFLMAQSLGCDVADGHRCTVLEMGVMQGSRNFGASHSYGFENSLGWHTILIEANPQMEEPIRKNRPNATLHMVPICSKPTTLHFLLTTAVGLNGFQEFKDAARFQKRMDSRGVSIVETIPMQCQPISKLLKSEPVIDAFFLDVEGAEFSVLQTMNFTETCVQVFNIEAGGPSTDVGSFLQAAGFTHAGWNTEKFNHVWVNSVKCRK